MKYNEKLCIKTEKVIDRGKGSKILSEVRSFEKVSKNLQSLLVIRPLQKEVLPSHKLQDHACEY